MLEKLTIHELRDKILNREVTIKQVLDEVFRRIDNVENKIDAFVTVMRDEAYERAEKLQSDLENGKTLGALFGIPVAIKDNMCMKNTLTTCSSKILSNFVSPYDATVVKKLEEAGAIIIGKTNMDEFAMGSSTATSYIKKTKNPWDLERVPGGSSGGSAASVASDMVIASLGSDTGGSIRQPASYCSVVGLKPTYGLVSRYGLVAFASSLDQIGPFTKDVKDAAIMLDVIKGHDKMDTTSMNIEYPEYEKELDGNVEGLKIGVPRAFIMDGLNEEIKESFENSLKTLESLGAKIVDISLDYAKYALPAYYIIATAEASSNLARFDGIRYGYRTKNFENLDDIYKNSRTEGFGDEVKRRIMLGTYVLSSGYYDAYYKRAGQVRTLITKDFENAFNEVDVIALPTAPHTAFKFGEKSNNPVEMYLEDIFTVPVNIAGLPAISVPCGVDSNNLPMGLQFIARAFDEKTMLKVALGFETATNFNENRPNI